jgi:DNA uptake protein ComE-like DNA-binding protein
MPYSDEFKRFFQFTQSERKGIFILIFILFTLICVLQIDFLPNPNKSEALRNSISDTAVFAQKKDSKWTRNTEQPIASRVKANPKNEALFFDPNSANKEAMIAIGIYPNLAERIIKYRTKGGQFKSAIEIKKIFGFSEKLYAKVSSKIKVDTALLNKTKFKPEIEVLSKDAASNLAPNSDINTMSFRNWMQLLNDSQLVIRILKYKVALGGYFDLQQLSEVSELPDSVHQFLILKCTVKEEDVFRKINLNLAEAYELKRHPYIKYKLAQLIMAYRQNRPFETIEDLKKLPIVNDALFKKLKYYVFVTPNG